MIRGCNLALSPTRQGVSVHFKCVPQEAIYSPFKNYGKGNKIRFLIDRCLIFEKKRVSRRRKDEGPGEGKKGAHRPSAKVGATTRFMLICFA